MTLSLRGQFFRDRLTLSIALATLVALGWSWAAIVSIPEPRGTDTPSVILHATIYFGIQRLGEWSTLLWYPGLATAACALQMMMAAFLYERMRFWSAILTVGTFLVALVVFMVSLYLLHINT